MCLCECVCSCILISMQVQVCVHECVYMHTCCMHVYWHMCMYMWMCIHVWESTLLYLFICTPVYIILPAVLAYLSNIALTLSPVRVTVDDSALPLGGCLHQLYGPLQGLPALADNTVTNLQKTSHLSCHIMSLIYDTVPSLLKHIISVT